MSAPYHKPQARQDRELLRHLHRRLTSSTIPVPLQGETYGKWHARMMDDLAAVRDADAEAYRKEYGPWHAWEYQEWHAKEQERATAPWNIASHGAAAPAVTVAGGSQMFPHATANASTTPATPTPVVGGAAVPAHGEGGSKAPVPPMVGTFGTSHGAK